MTDASLLSTPLTDLHRELGARLVPFAGYEMPVQYPQGIIAEHSHTREKAGLFDVSHMGQAWLVGPDFETTAAALERITPSAIAALKRAGVAIPKAQLSSALPRNRASLLRRERSRGSQRGRTRRRWSWTRPPDRPPDGPPDGSPLESWIGVPGPA